MCPFRLVPWFSLPPACEVSSQPCFALLGVREAPWIEAEIADPPALFRAVQTKKTRVGFSSIRASRKILWFTVGRTPTLAPHSSTSLLSLLDKDRYAGTLGTQFVLAKGGSLFMA